MWSGADCLLLLARFVGFGLVALIIVNASCASIPIVLSGSYIYRVGYG